MKILSGSIVFSDAENLYHNYQGPSVNLWTTGTVGQKFVSVMSAVSLSVSDCGEKCLNLLTPSGFFTCHKV